MKCLPAVLVLAGALGSGSFNAAADDKVIKREGQSLWIGIDRDSKGRPVFSLGPGEADPPAGREDQQIKTQQQLLQSLDATLKAREGKGKVVIWVKAHLDLPARVVRELQVELGKRRDRVGRVYLSVAKPPFYRVRKGPDNDTSNQPPTKHELQPVVTKDKVSSIPARPIRLKAWQHKGSAMISVEEKEVKEKDLTSTLERLVRAGREGLLIETDDAIRYSALLKIMDAAKAAKIKRIQLFHAANR